MKSLKITIEDTVKLVKLHKEILIDNNFTCEPLLWDNHKGFDVYFYDIEYELQFVKSYEYANETDKEVFEGDF